MKLKNLIISFLLIFSLLGATSCSLINFGGTNPPSNDETTWVDNAIHPEGVSAFDEDAFVAINNGVPKFSSAELTTVAYEFYSDLDSLGRCGIAIASCGKEIMPKPDEQRGNISSVTPSGWVQAQYDSSIISTRYLYNRAHLIGWQLSAENANSKNLITGTRYLNVEGMLPFENMVADYIKETNNHVAYRITPFFYENNLVCSGVQMEAFSIEDNGEGVSFNVYCYNVQPGIVINYKTGQSRLASDSDAQTPPSSEDSNNSESGENESTEKMVYRTNTGKRYHLDKDCAGKNGYEVSLEDAIKNGLTACGTCARKEVA